MQVKIDDSSMGKTVCLDSVLNANMNIVEPTKARGVIVRTVVAGRAYTDEGLRRSGAYWSS
jgi:hypothetical protein